MIIVLKIEKGERRMQKKIVIPILVTLMLAMLAFPAFAWVYPDGSTDAVYEQFGSRADSLLINLYADDIAEFDALEAGDIDITDWPIPKALYEKWTGPGYEYINVVNYGPEFGLFLLDLNSNNNQYLDNPPNPAYPNPVADRNPATGNAKIAGGAGPANDYNPMSDVHLRRAIAYLVNRDEYVADPAIGAGFGYPMYTMMPVAMEKYILDVPGNEELPWGWLYSRAAAEGELDGNNFPINTETGYRYWDRNTNGVEEPDEWVEILFYIRSDHPGRNMIGTKLLVELAAVNLRVNPTFAASAQCSPPVMYEEDFHMYTGGWSLGVDPDHLILWSWDYYQHPGFCYNYGGHNDPDFNEAADGIMYANTQEEAVAFAMQAQYAQCYNVLSIPVYCVSGNKGYHKTYSGPESYNGEDWIGVTNVAGYGIDSFWSFLNMHPECPMVGTGDMVIRWGFKSSELANRNPVYSQWLWEWNMMGMIYESLLARNASDLGQFMPWLVKDFRVDTYPHPTLGECSRITFTLRDDVYWSDGTKMTIADIYFTFVELKQILEDSGLPTPWWYSNVADILSFSILDPCNFEVLLGVKSYWAVGWIGGNIILPKHIWKPIAETGDPEAPQPDPLLIGSGPYKFVEYVEFAYCRLDKNPTYFRNTPLTVEIKIDGVDPDIEYRQIVKPCTPPEDVWFVVTLHNGKVLEPGMVTANLIVDKYIYFTDKTAETKTLVKVVTDITLEPCVPDVENVTLDEIGTALGEPFACWPVCSHDLDVEVHIKGPAEFCPTQPNPWVSTWKNVTFDWWGTIIEDVGGSYYVNPQLTAPDCKVDLDDVLRAALAFGSFPGHPAWSTTADLTNDLKIDLGDYLAIALKFGWPYT